MAEPTDMGNAAPTLAEPAPVAAVVCPECREALPADARYCTTCGAALPGVTTESAEAAPAAGGPVVVACPQCGAEIAADPAVLTQTCPFCDTPYVGEQVAGGHPLVPEFVVPFKVPREEAERQLAEWRWSVARWRDRSAVDALAAAKLRGVYVPYWGFQGRTQTSWQARIGEIYYETETYWDTETYTDSQGHTQTRSVQKTRQVQRTDWYDLANQHHHYYPMRLVVASRGLPEAVLRERVEPFDVTGLRRYDPDYLAGWLAERPAVARAEALATARERLAAEERARIAGTLPGDSHELKQADVQLSDVYTDLVLMPLWIATYMVGEERKSFLLNGQTGRAGGEAPPVAGKWWALVGVLIVLIVAALLVVLWLTGALGQ
jgi:hypothetical protein